MRIGPGRDRLAVVRLPKLVIGGLLLLGCAPIKGFVYQPNPPISAAPRVPVTVVVLPFEDATPEWETNQGLGTQWNLTKFAPDNKEPYIPPERWAHEFTKELRASGAFSSVSYSEGGGRADGKILIRGKVLSALFRTYVNSGPFEYSVQFKAIRGSDGKTLWERTVSRQVESSYANVGEVTKTLWRSMFGEAVADLVKELESRRSEWGTFRGEPAAPASGEGESVEEILRKINKQ